jgi:hypothetical protein
MVWFCGRLSTFVYYYNEDIVPDRTCYLVEPVVEDVVGPL